MLKQRIATALILLPLVLAAIFVLPVPWFIVALFSVALIAIGEYRRLAGLGRKTSGNILMILQAVILLALALSRISWNSYIVLIMSGCCVAWLLMFTRLASYRPDSQPDESYRVISFLTALASITTGFFALGWIRTLDNGSWLILLLLLIVWAADTGAYFAGKTFGKNKLAPKISPGKTREGLIGGLIAAPLVAVAAAQLMPITAIDSVSLTLLSLATAIASVAGDLLISMHKRISGFKDSGNLLPGHGGILDRVDSLIAAAPFFALGILLWGRAG